MSVGGLVWLACSTAALTEVVDDILDLNLDDVGDSDSGSELTEVSESLSESLCCVSGIGVSGAEDNGDDVAVAVAVAVKAAADRAEVSSSAARRWR